MAIRLPFMFVRTHMLKERIAHCTLETRRMVSRAHGTDDTTDDRSMASATKQSTTTTVRWPWAATAHMRLRRRTMLLLLLLLWLSMSLSLSTMHTRIIIRSRDIDIRAPTTTMMIMVMIMAVFVVEIWPRNTDPRNFKHLNILFTRRRRPSRIPINMDHRRVDIDERQRVTPAAHVRRRVDVDHRNRWRRRRRLYSGILGSGPPTMVLGIAPIVTIRLELWNICHFIPPSHGMRRLDTHSRRRSRCLWLISSGGVERRRRMTQLLLLVRRSGNLRTSPMLPEGGGWHLGIGNVINLALRSSNTSTTSFMVVLGCRWG